MPAVIAFAGAAALGDTSAFLKARTDARVSTLPPRTRSSVYEDESAMVEDLDFEVVHGIKMVMTPSRTSSGGSGNGLANKFYSSPQPAPSRGGIRTAKRTSRPNSRRPLPWSWRLSDA